MMIIQKYNKINLLTNRKLFSQNLAKSILIGNYHLLILMIGQFKQKFHGMKKERSE